MGKVSNLDFFKQKAPDKAVAEVKKEPEAQKSTEKIDEPANVPAEKIVEPVKKPETPAKKAVPPVRKKAPEKKVEEELFADSDDDEILVKPEPESIAVVKVSEDVSSKLMDVVKLFEGFGRKTAAIEIENIYKRSNRNRFSVAVVGEFSRGKSTFINNFIGGEILPVGDLPTTALLTRIRYNDENRMAYFNASNQRISEMPLVKKSWKGLTAENFRRTDPTGTVLIGIKSTWLGRNNIEIMDTPGAGDLEEKRAKAIGEALLGSDGAIITIDATSPLSMTEKLFIEQRLISRKTPFLMLIITKLDMVRKRERAQVVDYIKKKLSSWNMNIPVFIPYEVETDDDRFKEIMGMEKVKNHILSWINSAERIKFTEDWIVMQAISVIERELSSYSEQRALIEADEAKRKELIKEKKQKLVDAEIEWEELRLQMLRRCNTCYERFLQKVDEATVTMVERLQFEVSHSNNPEKWWTQDYAYRLKVELASLSTSIENQVSRTFAEDTRWFNNALERNFRTHILCEQRSQDEKAMQTPIADNRDLEFENIDKKRVAVRVGTAALSIAGYAICASVGFIPLIATIGIGTGSSIISETVFKKKIENQRSLIKEAIATEVPRIIAESTNDSKSYIKSIYEDTIKAAKEKEKLWKEAQKTAMENSIIANENSDRNGVKTQIELIEKYLGMFKAM